MSKSLIQLPNCHLDLGCGQHPRNPYNKEHIFGIDVIEQTSRKGVDFIQANLACEPIPFPDNHFGSVSAFDFLEHIPRIAYVDQGHRTHFPFINLMNEIWRVLAHGGLFYALTPAYPSAEAFNDPTHVNFIGESTHTYFCDSMPLGQAYGFRGLFKSVRIERVLPDVEYDRANAKWSSVWREWRWKRQGKCTHLVWELKALKPLANTQ